MSILGQLTHTNIDLWGAIKKALPKAGAEAVAVLGQLPVATARDTIILEIEKDVIPNVVSAINNLMVSKGLASDVNEADALIRAELASLGLAQAGAS